MEGKTNISRMLDETVRSERGWLISSLVSSLGPSKIDLAEDVAQDAILKALSTWPYKGIPDNPRAWLRRVAGNAAIDRIRRSSKELGLDPLWDPASSDDAVITPSLSDPELDLIVLCCEPEIAPIDQLFLALKTVSGFTAAETAALFFTKEDALSQRLARAKRKLKAQAGRLARFPTRFALRERLPRLQKVIYLMFAWGYAPRQGNDLFRKELCLEALRLSEGLLKQTEGAAPGQHALHSLLLFQMARFPARQSPSGALLTLEHQDRSLWDSNLLAQANHYLAQAQTSETLTRYHLEAGIAALHAQAPKWSETPWRKISRLYQLLAEHTPSLSVLVNWAVVLIHLEDTRNAQSVLEQAASKRGAQDFAGYHLARAKYAERIGDTDTARSCLEAASTCQVSAPVSEFISEELNVISITD